MAATTLHAQLDDFDFVTLAQLAAVPVLGDLLPAVDATRGGCRSSSSARRCTTASTSAVARPSATSAPALLVHVAYLALLGLAGITIATRRLGRLLTP